jgi:hypothetical protein
LKKQLQMDVLFHIFMKQFIWWYFFLCIFATLLVVYLFNSSYFRGFKVVSPCGFIFIFLLITDTKYLFMCFLASHVSSLVNYIIYWFAHFLIVLFSYWIVKVLYIFRLQMFSRARDSQMFSPRLWLIFSVSFEVKKKN